MGKLLGIDVDSHGEIEEISKLSDKNKEAVYTFLDSFLAISQMHAMLKNKNL